MSTVGRDRHTRNRRPPPGRGLVAGARHVRGPADHPDVVDAAAARAAEVLDEVDLACSRFRDDSDLALANRSAGTPVAVSPVLVGAVRVALEAATETDGIVDPTLGDLLTAAGYDRTFALVPADDPSPAGSRCGEAAGVTSSSRRTRSRSLSVPRSTSGPPARPSPPTSWPSPSRTPSTSPSWWVSVVTCAWPGPGARHRRSGGLPGRGRPQPRRPRRRGPRTRVTLSSGGLATSSVSARRWRRGGRQWHHLVDPRTGTPGRGVLAHRDRPGAHRGRGQHGDDGRHRPRRRGACDWLTARGVAARLVDHEGRVSRTPDWVALGVEEQP